jgi:ABC-type glycerol-3-phosphate transport system substrate-binding protein
MKKNIILVCVIELLIFGACSAPPQSAEQEDVPETPSTTQVSPSITITPQADADSDTPTSLQIWLPPIFDPSNDNQAAVILKARLQEFVDSHPDVSIETRVKALEGDGGMLESLSSAYQAAPLALPDLIFLPDYIFDSAIRKGFIISIDEFLPQETELDWYEFAWDTVIYDARTYGLPFASDALVLAYNSEDVETPPISWEDLLEFNHLLVFPAADPMAYTTIAFYLSTGGKYFDENGNPTLDRVALSQLFEFYQQARFKRIMPFWLDQYSRDSQSWNLFTDDRADMAITWFTTRMNDPVNPRPATLIPTPDGIPFTMTSTWYIALASSQLDHQAISAELALYLTEVEFLAEWTTTAGYIPPRASALAAWSQDASRAFTNQIVSAAMPMPPSYVLQTIQGPLSQATAALIGQEINSATAVDNILNALTIDQ